jgi:branched-chain amino acid transport system substrate-binding protein
MGFIALFGFVGTSFSAEPINIGLIGNFSSFFGAGHKKALELSVADINAAGGILGRQVNLIQEDNKGQVPLSIAAYQKLVMTDKCLAVFTEGSETTISCREVGARIYPDYPHLQLGFYAVHPGITVPLIKEYEKYKFLFRLHMSGMTFYGDGLDLAGAIKTICKIQNPKSKDKPKLALIIEDMKHTEPYRKGIPGVFMSMPDFFKSKGFEIVYYLELNPKETMFMPIFDRVAESKADAIFCATSYTDNVTMIKQWASSSARNIGLHTNLGMNEVYWKMTDGKALGLSTLAVDVPIPYTNLSIPAMTKLKNSGVSVADGAYAAFDGPWIIKQAVEKAGTVKDVGAIIKAIENNESQHYFYKWIFDKQHDPAVGFPPGIAYPIFQFQEDGRPVVYHPETVRKLANPNDGYVKVDQLGKRKR